MVNEAWPEGTPGSEKAYKAGCTCPSVDNGFGKNDNAFVMDDNCRLHRHTQAMHEYNKKQEKR